MEGVIPPRGWRPRGFLTQKIMKKRRDWIINCFILIYFRKPYKIHQNVQRFSLNTFGETTSPLSRKSINCSSVIAFPFVWFLSYWFSSTDKDVVELYDISHGIPWKLFTWYFIIYLQYLSIQIHSFCDRQEIDGQSFWICAHVLRRIKHN